ncbi:aldo/keto reductase [Mangrovactinospora gilvigrisea]|uniref:Aldo/keto reductase n=2 Tax=Mangrovactinospora gilvigrisea TaxID=1428644 RepID=A0A1J7CFQ7_9ACTN|nr:aldo/keto reductase [Mangrovactinospora gilvigrisea]
MEYRRLGSSGLVVSAVGVGCNQFGGKVDAAIGASIVDAALEEGVTLFDTADVYGAAPGASEEALGQALKGRRDQVVLATKFGSDMRGGNGPDWGARGGRRYIRIAVEASLRRLGTDWIDLYQIHRPDPATPIEETLDALGELVREGKIRYAGCSNYAAWEVADAGWTARTRHLPGFVSAQNKYSLLDRAAEDELVPACEAFGLGLLPYFPLEHGLLTGKYRRGEAAPAGTRLADERRRRILDGAPWDVIEGVEAFGKERGLSPLDVAIAGLAAQPAVSSVIAGVTGPDQLRANARALRWQPEAAEIVELDALTSGGDAFGA